MVSDGSAYAIENQLAASRVLPVLALQDVGTAAPLAAALRDGGITMIEITFRTAAAGEAMAAAAAVEGITVGAGTVTHKEQLVEARAAGARFAVSPGTDLELLAVARAIELPMLPGVATATEVMTARSAGYRVVKFFPAEAMGGIATLHAFQGPFAELHFCPTGGISAANFESYLALANVVAVGGSWLAPADAVDARDWPRITALATAARQAADAVASNK